MSMDTEDPWAPPAAPPSIINAEEEGWLDPTGQLPEPSVDLTEQTSGQVTEQMSGQLTGQADRSAGRLRRAARTADRLTGPSGLPVIAPVRQLLTAVPAGRKARAADRSARIEQPLTDWLEIGEPAMRAMKEKAKTGDSGAYEKYEEWRGKKTALQPQMDAIANKEREKALIKWCVITVTVLWFLINGYHGWLYLLFFPPVFQLLIPPVMLAIYLYKLGRDGQAADRSAAETDRSGDRGQPVSPTGQANRSAAETDRSGDRGQPVSPTGQLSEQTSGQLTGHDRSGEPVSRSAVRSADTGQVEPLTGQVEPDNGQLHPHAARLEKGLRVYSLIDKTAEITATAPISMQVGDQPANGTSFVVTLPVGCTASAVIKKHHEMAGVFDTVDEKLILLPAGGSNQLLWVWRCDWHPLGGPGTWSPLQDGLEVNVWKGWRFGFTLTGEEVIISPVGDRLVIAGSPGAGKSASASLIPLGFGLDPHTKSLLLDPEGFGAFAPFAKIATVIQGSEPRMLRKMAEALRDVVEKEFPARQREVERLRREEPRRMATDSLDESITRDRRYNLPAMLILVSECAALFNAPDPDTAKMAQDACIQIAQRCRKYAITLVLDGQKFTTDNIPSAITAMSTSQFLMACQTESMCKAVIPEWRDLGLNPLKALQPDDGRGGGTPGGGYLKGRCKVSPPGPVSLMRTDYVASANVWAMIDLAEALRREIRPELLDQPAVPKATPGEVMADDALEPDDPDHLEALVAVFGPGENQLHSVTIIDRLRERYPLDPTYRTLTERGMNKWLKPWGLVASPAREGEKVLRGFYLADVQAALTACYAADLEPVTQGERYEVGYDQKGALTSTVTEERSDTEGAESPESGRKPHLGDLPLNALPHPGGFS